MEFAVEFAPAPFWRRLVARTIDLLVCVPLTFIAAIPLTLVLFPLTFVMAEDAWSSMGAFLCFVVAYALVEYFLLRRRSGQTLGKGLLGLRVLDAADRDGTGSISGASALRRMLVLIGPLLAALAAFYLTYDSSTGTSDSAVADLLVWLWVIVLAACAVAAIVDRRTHRGLHDTVSGTRVVRAERRGIALKEDLKMMVPGRVSLEKRPPAAPVTLTKTL